MATEKYLPVEIKGAEVTLEVRKGPNLETLICNTFYLGKISELSGEVDFEICLPVLGGETGERTKRYLFVRVVPVAVQVISNSDAVLDVKGYMNNCPLDRCRNSRLVPPITFGNYNHQERTGIVTISTDLYRLLVAKMGDFGKNKSLTFKNDF